MDRWKARGWLPVSANWTFFASSHGWGDMSKHWSKLCCLKGGWVTLSTNFSRKERLSTNEFWRQKTRVPGLSFGVVWVILRLAVLIQYRRVTHRHTHRQTDIRWWLIPAHRLRRAGKNYEIYILFDETVSRVSDNWYFQNFPALCSFCRRKPARGLHAKFLKAFSKIYYLLFI